jgi:hypothetical protein
MNLRPPETDQWFPDGFGRASPIRNSDMRDIMFTTICLAVIAAALSGSLLIVDKVKADTTATMIQ